MASALSLRFWSKVLQNPGETACWTFTGATSKGYGRFWAHGRLVQAHRFAFERTYGPVDRTLDVDHLCRNRACVRPSHLRAVDHRTNVLAGIGITAHLAAMTHCTKGHPLARRGTQRRCVVCRRERQRRDACRRRRVAARARLAQIVATHVASRQAARLEGRIY